MLVERIDERSVLIMLTLVGMEDWLGFSIEPSDCLVQHFADELVCGTVRHGIGNDLTVSQVHHRREVELLPEEVKLSDVGHPFLVQAGGLKVPLEKVRRDLPDSPLIGAVSLHADEALKPELVHETAYGLRVVPEALAFEECVDATIATSPLVFVEEGMDGCLHLRILVFARQARPPVVVDASGHTEHAEESRDGIDRPQLVDHLRLDPVRRAFSS